MEHADPSDVGAAEAAAALRGLLARRRHAEALAHLEQHLPAHPDDPELLAYGSDLHARAGNAAQVRALVGRALALGLGTPVSDARLLDRLGSACFRIGDVTHAEALFRRAVALAGRDSAELRFNLAAACRALGKLDEAEALYDQVLAQRPEDFEAIRNRSELRTQTSNQNHVAELVGVLNSGLPPDGAIRVGFALGKELEDLGRYQEAFTAYARANAQKRSNLRYAVADDVATMDALLTSGMPAASEPAAVQANSRPIFVIGLPRTGTTLLERVLASHPEVVSVGESTAFPLAMARAHRLTGLPRPDNGPARVAQFERIDPMLLARCYLDELRRQHEVSDTTTVDKLPLNYLHVALIRRAFPQAEIVLLERDPLDTVVALYRTLFAAAYPFSYDLDEIGTYLIAYRRLMAHWHSVVSRLHLVSYERLVADPEPVVRALLSACALEWCDACLYPERLRQASTTASAVQVRAPIHSRSVGQWRRHAQELDSVRIRLRAAGLDAGD